MVLEFSVNFLDPVYSRERLVQENYFNYFLLVDWLCVNNDVYPHRCNNNVMILFCNFKRKKTKQLVFDGPVIIVKNYSFFLLRGFTFFLIPVFDWFLCTGKSLIYVV